MMVEREMAVNEAKNRIKELTEKYDLNPNILKYFEEGKLYYSYLTFGGMVGSIDTISYDESYDNAVKKFEAENPGYVVYHAIETNTRMGKTLSMLYVGADSDNWPAERLYGNYIFAYTVNFADPDFSEFGDIVVSGFEESGALVRRG